VRKSAFTLIEMIFVITILGIVAGMTFVQISSVYEDFIQKQSSSELEMEAKVIAEQVTARLSSSVKESLTAMTDLNGNGCLPVSGTLTPATNYTLAWIGKSDEANLGIWDTTITPNDYKPGWSGFVDVSASDTTSIITRGSRLDFAETLIDGLSGQVGSLSQAANSPVALYFNDSASNANACTDFGFSSAAVSAAGMYQVYRNGTTNQLTLIDRPTQIFEQYTLSHSAYAIQRDAGNNLWLYSFRPWLGQKPINDAAPALLGKNVSGFSFKWSGGLFRVNICVKKTMSGGYDVEVCKEKAVF
jgi:prepilin-type N-terminal cleavage/methylation domain-containing protein